LSVNKRNGWIKREHMIAEVIQQKKEGMKKKKKKKKKNEVKENI